MKVPHPYLPEEPRVVLVEEDPVVVHAAGISPAAGVLAVLSNTAVAGADVAALLAVLLKSGCHLCLRQD